MARLACFGESPQLGPSSHLRQCGHTASRRPGWPSRQEAAHLTTALVTVTRDAQQRAHEQAGQPANPAAAQERLGLLLPCGGRGHACYASAWLPHVTDVYVETAVGKQRLRYFLLVVSHACGCPRLPALLTRTISPWVACLAPEESSWASQDYLHHVQNHLDRRRHADMVAAQLRPRHVERCCTLQLSFGHVPADAWVGMAWRLFATDMCLFQVQRLSMVWLGRQWYLDGLRGKTGPGY